MAYFEQNLKLTRQKYSSEFRQVFASKCQKKNNTYRLFIYQDEDENEPEDEFFRSFRIKTVTNEPGPQYYDTLKDRFVRHAQVPERTKALVFVFVFVFVLAHEQAISIRFCCIILRNTTKPCTKP